MYVAQLTMARRTDFDLQAVSMAVNGFLAALRNNGQVCGREFPVSMSEAAFIATVLVPEPTSLESSHHNRYVRMAIDEILTVGLGEPSISVAEDMDGDDPCSCAHRSGLILYTTFLSLEPPLRCLDCFRSVPLYTTPALRDDEYSDVISWQSSYQECDALQMRCDVLERAATREMSRLDSRLSKIGLDLCRQISQNTQVPVYYYLYRYSARPTRAERKRLCPSCQGEWLLAERLHHFDFKCDRCHLLSNIAGDGTEL